MLRTAEYVWLDGSVPTQQLRSKTRIVDVPDDGPMSPTLLPEWGFDGSSTGQATGHDSDCILSPVAVVRDPIRLRGILVLCEVLNPDRTPHQTNQRAVLRAVLAAGGAAQQPWFGFEQEYTLFADGRPLGFPASGLPAPQGPYYCSVGAGVAFGRAIVEAHLRACLDAGLMIYGINAEVMPGQWEFQVGYRGVGGEAADPLTVSDHLWLARWLLHRIAEDEGVTVSFAVKPMAGNWNGAGNHTNFSTQAMREEGSGLGAIQAAIARLSERHVEHIAEYGEGLEARLTGLPETSSIERFLSGVADRGASIRIPRSVQLRGSGYLEDRRPGANCDPYRVARLITQTVCGLSDGPDAVATATPGLARV